MEIIVAKSDESEGRSATTAELMVGRSPDKRLSQWLATGICGNDITSSCLYVSAIAAVFAGVMAPVVLLMVIGVLYLYKNLMFFLRYFIPTILLVVMMYLRIPLLKAILQLLNNMLTRLLVWRTMVLGRISATTNQRVMVFTRGANMSRLHDAFNYIRQNESSRSIVVFHLFSSPDDDESEAIKQCLETLGQIFTMLRVEFYSRRQAAGIRTGEGCKTYTVRTHFLRIRLKRDFLRVHHFLPAP